jgi:hypothetical protein
MIPNNIPQKFIGMQIIIQRMPETLTLIRPADFCTRAHPTHLTTEFPMGMGHFC